MYIGYIVVYSILGSSLWYLERVSDERMVKKIYETSVIGKRDISCTSNIVSKILEEVYMRLRTTVAFATLFSLAFPLGIKVNKYIHSTTLQVDTIYIQKCMGIN